MTTPDHRDGRAAGNVARDDARNLLVRIASALVLGPIVLVSAYIGGWLFLALCTVGGGGILWEWAVLIGRKADPRVLAPGFAALAAAFAVTALDESVVTVVVAIAVGALVAGLAARSPPPGAGASGGGIWAAGGVIYAGAAFLGPALLRRDPQLGFVALLFLFATVWMTDTFAFLCGRAIGGPPLWPSVSPNKTWAGAIGGLAGGVAGAAVVAYASGVGKWGIAGLMGLLLSVLAQLGDLFESAVKRRFGVKDTSHFIPGHGGLMDRLDGFLVAALAALVIGVARQGTDAPAHGLLLW